MFYLDTAAAAAAQGLQYFFFTSIIFFSPQFQIQGNEKNKRKEQRQRETKTLNNRVHIQTHTHTDMHVYIYRVGWKKSRVFILLPINRKLNGNYFGTKIRKIEPIIQFVEGLKATATLLLAGPVFKIQKCLFESPDIRYVSSEIRYVWVLEHFEHLRHRKATASKFFFY